LGHRPPSRGAKGARDASPALVIESGRGWRGKCVHTSLSNPAHRTVSGRAPAPTNRRRNPSSAPFAAFAPGVRYLQNATPRALIREAWCEVPWSYQEELDTMIRYGFTIRTRMGQRIENVSIIAGSQKDAERRLRQMYLQCDILECREKSIPRRFEPISVANMIDLMAISPPTIQHHG